jgi:hypothetical protein
LNTADRARRLVRTPWIWVALAAFILVVAGVITSLDRFPEWDEAVFYSQSGGFAGNDASPSYLAPTREGGTPFLIGFIRVFGLGLAGVRAVWAVLAVALAAFAYWRAGKHFERSTGLFALGFFGLSWLTLAYLGSFYGSLLAGIFMVLAAVFLLDLADPDRGSRRAEILAGIGLGLSFAGMFWMRQFESILALGVLVIASVLLGGAFVWRRRLAGVAVAAGSFVLTFAVPWAIWSTVEFGSVAQRWQALGDRSAELPSLQITNGAPSYLKVFVGRFTDWGLYSRVPVWPGIVIGLSVVLLLVLIAIAWREAGRTPGGSRPFAVFAGLVVAQFVFYVFVYSTVEVQERYMTTVLPIFAVLAGAGLAVGYRTYVAPGPRSRWLLVSGILAIWLVAQIAIANPYQTARYYYGDEVLNTSETIRDLAGAETCTGVSRLGAPQLHLGTGCMVFRSTDPEQAIARAQEAADGGKAAFIVWPGNVSEPLELGPSWMVVDRSTEWINSVLYFRPAAADG